MGKGGFKKPTMTFGKKGGHGCKQSDLWDFGPFFNIKDNSNVNWQKN